MDVLACPLEIGMVCFCCSPMYHFLAHYAMFLASFFTKGRRRRKLGIDRWIDRCSLIFHGKVWSRLCIVNCVLVSGDAKGTVTKIS